MHGLSPVGYSRRAVEGYHGKTQMDDYSRSKRPYNQLRYKRSVWVRRRLEIGLQMELYAKQRCWRQGLHLKRDPCSGNDWSIYADPLAPCRMRVITQSRIRVPDCCYYLYHQACSWVRFSHCSSAKLPFPDQNSARLSQHTSPHVITFFGFPIQPTHAYVVSRNHAKSCHSL